MVRNSTRSWITGRRSGGCAGRAKKLTTLSPTSGSRSTISDLEPNCKELRSTHRRANGVEYCRCKSIVSGSILSISNCHGRRKRENSAFLCISRGVLVPYVTRCSTEGISDDPSEGMTCGHASIVANRLGLNRLPHPTHVFYFDVLAVDGDGIGFLQTRQTATHGFQFEAKIFADFLPLHRQSESHL